MNFDSDVALADESDANGPKIDAVNPDLSKFQKRGGKLIEYQGWLDANLAPYSVEHYENVVAAIEKGDRDENDSQALQETQSFYRLFVVPAMGHCRGGPGPNSFGAETHPAGPLDPQHNIFSALEAWVEHGVAPKEIIAAKYVKDDPKQGITNERPLCPYPQEARYKGKGSTADASNFVCANAPRNLKPTSVSRASAGDSVPAARKGKS
jgi:Tannase and feruloyl esterase